MLECQAREEQFILGNTEDILLQNNSLDETYQLDVRLNCSGYVCNTVIAVMLVYNLTQQLFVQVYVKFVTVLIK